MTCKLTLNFTNFLFLIGEKCEYDIVKKLTKMVTFCEVRNYIAAKSVYFELAIGNAPWPVGVTRAGIHERAGGTKIEEHEVARKFFVFSFSNRG